MWIYLFTEDFFSLSEASFSLYFDFIDGRTHGEAHAKLPSHHCTCNTPVSYRWFILKSANWTARSFCEPEAVIQYFDTFLVELIHNIFRYLPEQKLSNWCKMGRNLLDLSLSGKMSRTQVSKNEKHIENFIYIPANRRWNH